MFQNAQILKIEENAEEMKTIFFGLATQLPTIINV
jgi:hypothetical protein